MTARIDNVARCIDLACRIASGELSEGDGAMEILKLVHACSDEARNSMADALLNRRKEAA